MCFQLYERSLEIHSFKILDGASESDLDLNAPIGTVYQLTPSSTVTIIDPYSDYIAVLKECFDFGALKNFIQKRPDFRMIFDGMHGAGGPFARKILAEELGLPEVRGSKDKHTT
jgi:phosphoglucomutase